MRSQPSRPSVSTSFRRNPSDATQPRPAAYRATPQSTPLPITGPARHLPSPLPRTSSDATQQPPATSHSQLRSLIGVKPLTGALVATLLDHR